LTLAAADNTLSELRTKELVIAPPICCDADLDPSIENIAKGQPGEGNLYDTTNID
jgi:hypothetical protein